MKTISIVLVTDVTSDDRQRIADQVRSGTGCLSFRYLSDDPGRATSRIGQIKVDEQHCDQMLIDLRQLPAIDEVQVESQRNLIR